MIGLGVAGALMAGQKAIVVWFPKERVVEKWLDAAFSVRD
jgi:hypothetical protein